VRALKTWKFSFFAKIRASWISSWRRACRAGSDLAVSEADVEVVVVEEEVKATSEA